MSKRDKLVLRLESMSKCTKAKMKYVVGAGIKGLKFEAGIKGGCAVENGIKRAKKGEFGYEGGYAVGVRKIRENGQFNAQKSKLE